MATELSIDLQKSFVVTEAGGYAVEIRRGFMIQGWNNPDLGGAIVDDPEAAWGLLVDEIEQAEGGDAAVPGAEFDTGDGTAILVDRDITID